MTFNAFLRDVRRGLFVVAFLFLLLAIGQRGFMFFGLTLPGITIDPSSFLDWAFMTLAWRYSADRMVMDYAQRCYLPAALGDSCRM